MSHSHSSDAFNKSGYVLHTFEAISYLRALRVCEILMIREHSTTADNDIIKWAVERGCHSHASEIIIIGIPEA